MQNINLKQIIKEENNKIIKIILKEDLQNIESSWSDYIRENVNQFKFKNSFGKDSGLAGYADFPDGSAKLYCENDNLNYILAVGCDDDELVNIWLNFYDENYDELTSWLYSDIFNKEFAVKILNELHITDSSMKFTTDQKWIRIN